MFSADLQLATEAAESAGKILLGFWAERETLTISNKRPGDFVSQADLASENHLKQLLLESRPGDGWLGEETGASESANRRWIVDPLDGTTNFLRGLPHWAVSIALEVSGELKVGVVHDPVNRETFSGEIGEGAFLNGKAIRVSGKSEITSALFGTGIPFGTLPHIPEHGSQIARLMPHCAGVRRIGAAALDLAYVAAGRFDGFWERNLKLWDIAAGLVILREAGAVVTGWEKHESSETKGDVVAATPELFEQFYKILNPGQS